MNEMKEIEEIKIEDMIYEVRGKQVMLDSDLARLYQCANGTKTINQAVARHKDRFPSDFCFQLKEYENYCLWSQLGTAKINKKSRSLPYVFTEQGVAMLATVLRTKVASSMSINIMRAFVTMRKYISSSLIEQRYINNMVLEDHDRIKVLEYSLNELEEKRKDNEIYFNGQIYDAYSNILNIFKKAKENLVIIDSYADNTTLDIVRRLKVDVVVITKKDNLLTKQDIEKYNKQYNNLKVINNNTFHDRYFILDKKQVYHCGTSINRIGYKTFCINVIGDDKINKLLINEVIRLGGYL